ncbi:MAG: YeaH/YhbH family protein [Kangiellaceae bacterium]|nr:YeaH/YhbH family protein [Kangiellaceae bacterium]
MQIIDRRLNQKNKSTVNRRRFLRRYRQQIKQVIAEKISERSVTDLEQNENIVIPSKDLSEPTFRHGSGGNRDRVFPGNKEFSQGDRISRPSPGSSGSGRRASDQGEGQDDFMFEISSEEYMEIMFEGLELPNLKKNKLKKLMNYTPIRSGFNTDGTPSNIDIVRSLKTSLARRIASQSPIKKHIRQLEESLTQADGETEKKNLYIELEELNARLKRVPYIDNYDLRYKNFDNVPQPMTNAVMFCLMDVSGSMGQETKEMAKRFYILLYLFLKRTYKDVKVIYIMHHTHAREVEEQEFFYSQETGGTIVSSALKLMGDIIQDRFPADEWNIYAAQASDGDNWTEDSKTCYNLLTESLLQLVRYFTYVEITDREPQNLWHEYESVRQQRDNFAMEKITQQEDIYPVFREFFQKQSVE